MRRGKKIGCTHEYDEYLCRICVFLRLVHAQYENVIATAHSMHLCFFIVFFFKLLLCISIILICFHTIFNIFENCSQMK